ncbi:MAG: hypothetical protein HY828_16460 [Actinobacteria bacterium]|nr:hypothetical protein [Actinomycetota bacterium]
MTLRPATLHDAAGSGDVDAVRRALTEGGADPNAMDHFHDTPGLVTGVNGSVAMGRVLLEAVILGDGSPVHEEIVLALLAAGAHPHLADREGITPLQHARSKGHTRLATILEEAQP